MQQLVINDIKFSHWDIITTNDGGKQPIRMEKKTTVKERPREKGKKAKQTNDQTK